VIVAQESMLQQSGEKRSTRDAYGQALLRLGETERRIVALDADLASSTRTEKFGRAFPERFFNVGIAEQNLYSVAAGLASCGKIPFASTFAVFATERALNQIKQCIAYPALNVKIVTSHSGFTPSGDGASHQSLIDIALMRSMPNMTVVVPADAVQTERAIAAAAAYEGPVYIRLGKTEVPIVFEQDMEFRIGESIRIRRGSDVTVLVTGILLGRAMEAAALAERAGIEAELINIHTIKPIDTAAIVGSARKTGTVVTVEEHSIIGGLGSATAEVLAEHHPVPLIRVGVKDTYGESGGIEELYEKHGLTAKQICESIRRAVRRKQEKKGSVCK
jgi:transketolase